MKIKLCGMFRDEDIDYVNEALPDYVGFIVMFPKSHRNIGLETALRLKSRLDPRIKSVDILQCHGSEDGEYIARLRELTGAPIIKAVRVTARSDIERAQALGADFLLLDGGTGSGKPFDHSLIDPGKIRQPFFLAGGLTPENLAETAKKVRPYGVDLSSGIETDKVKDRENAASYVGNTQICIRGTCHAGDKRHLGNSRDHFRADCIQLLIKIEYYPRELTVRVHKIPLSFCRYCSISIKKSTKCKFIYSITYFFMFFNC